MGIRHFVKKTFLKLGYTLLRGDVQTASRNMRAATLTMEHMPNCKVYPNRMSVLDDLPKGGIVAEVGVGYGDFSEILLKKLQPDLFIAIDFFALLTPNNEPWGKDHLTKLQLSHQQFYEQRFKEVVAQKKMEVRKGFSWEVLQQFPDEYFDFIYLDAAHDYDSVVKDIEQADKKLKKGGLIQFNDYTVLASTYIEPFGVPRAVHELLLKGGYKMTALCLEQHGYYDVVLKKDA